MHHSSLVSAHFIKYGSRKRLSSVGISWPTASLWVPIQLPDVQDSCGREQADADIWHGGASSVALRHGATTIWHITQHYVWPSAFV